MGTSPSEIRSVAALLSTDFVERGGLIMRADEPNCGETNAGAPIDATGLEALCTHVHVLDHFEHQAQVLEELPDDAGLDGSIYDPDHPDFLAAISIGLAAVWGWAIKLRQTFPEYRFRVYYSELDNPIVRCHRVRVEEVPWMTDQDIRGFNMPNRVMVIDTDGMRTVWSVGFNES
jgi:hypothetical protein